MTGNQNQLDINHLWLQVQELSAILQANRDSTHGLVRRADEIRGRVSTGEGGAFLRDVNGSLNGTREAELERDLTALRDENGALKTDNEDLMSLVTDYGNVLEKVLEGLRVYSHEHTMSTINIHQSYTAQLASERHANSVLRQNEADAQARLAGLAGMLRKAFEMTEEDVDAQTVIEGLKYENEVLRRRLGMGPGGEEEEVGGGGGGGGGGGVGEKKEGEGGRV